MKEILSNTIYMLNKKVVEDRLANETGSTCLISVIDTSEKIIHVANVGDSRCVLGYFTDIKQTKDHKPCDELERLKKAGANI